MDRERFWMVVGNGPPVHRHDTFESAKAEAERLARLNPGQEFAVMASIAVCKKTDVTWEEMWDHTNEVPF